MDRFQKSFKSGFSLLEMTVVLAIVSIMTAIVLVNLPQMKGGLSIDVISQEVAIYIRGAQVYSRATKSSGNTSSPIYSSFGLHFDSSSKNKSFFLWADGTGHVKDGDYSYVANDPKPENYDLPNGFTISRLGCFDDQNKLKILNQIDIVFQIPDPEAYFSGGCTSKVFVCLKSPNLEQYRVIETWNNGQISVINPTSANTSENNYPCVGS